MDAKKRVAIPSDWLRRKEGEEFYVIPHPFESFLMVMPPSELLKWEERFKEAKEMSPSGQRKAIRRFFAAAHRVTTDAQGRILLPEKYCESVGLNGTVAFLGGRSRFEIWDRARYAASTAGSEDDYNKIAEAIGL